jgi:glycosyltransferase involved in cell wall biosynthesis
MYSAGLISAFAEQDNEVAVLAMRREGSIRGDDEDLGPIQWRFTDAAPNSHRASLASMMPHMAHRCHTIGMKRRLKELLVTRPWDVIVFDGLSVGWALEDVIAYGKTASKRPKLVYISHNHEESLRTEIAVNQANIMKRQIVHYDAFKVARLERALIDGVDLVTSITQRDRSLYLVGRPRKQMIVLTPGYGGANIQRREIREDQPRRAIIVGSFDWIAKRKNITDFVRIADPMFSQAQGELQVVGSAEEGFLQNLRRGLQATQFVGSVPSISPYMNDARIAIVPEQLGGGFKLKTLDYVFHRLPIMAVKGSIAGIPLQNNISIKTFTSLDGLARGVLDAMDDLPLLNRLQEVAYSTCQSAFQWSDRGRLLHETITSL